MNARTAFVPNPALVGFLGLTPLVVVTANFSTGLLLTLITALGAVLAAAFAVFVRTSFPARLGLVAQIVFLAFYVLLVGLLVQAWSPVAAAALGIYLPLTAVNGLLLHEIRRGGAKDSPRFRTTLVSALGYLMVGISLSLFREVLGQGTLGLPGPGLGNEALRIFAEAPLPLLATPAGGFMSLALFASLDQLVLARPRRSEA